jgi:hypothetical protein
MTRIVFLLCLAAVGDALAQSPKPGEIPVPYPVVATTAQAGDYVLAPSRQFLDGAFAKGMDKQTFIFYAAQIVAPGPAESQVKSLAGTVFVVAKADLQALPLVRRMKAGQTVMAPVFGSFKSVSVESVDPAIGRVFVAYEFGGNPRKEAISFGDVAASLR